MYNIILLYTRETAALGGVSFALRKCRLRRPNRSSPSSSAAVKHKKIKINVTPILTQMVLKLPQGHEGSEYVLIFKFNNGKVVSIEN